MVNGHSMCYWKMAIVAGHPLEDASEVLDCLCWTCPVSGHHRYSQVASICFKPTWLEITEFALKNFYDHRYHRFHEFLDDFLPLRSVEFCHHHWPGRGRFAPPLWSNRGWFIYGLWFTAIGLKHSPKVYWRTGKSSFKLTIPPQRHNQLRTLVRKVYEAYWNEGPIIGPENTQQPWIRSIGI